MKEQCFNGEFIINSIYLTEFVNLIMDSNHLANKRNSIQTLSAQYLTLRSGCGLFMRGNILFTQSEFNSSYKIGLPLELFPVEAIHLNEKC